MTESKFQFIADKYGSFASWAVWAEEGITPKSNMGDLSIFDINANPCLLNIINPEVITVGLNFSRKTGGKTFQNFHDAKPQSQDYKIRFAFKDTPYYGAYMTDIIKDFEEKISGKVVSYLKNNRDFESQNINFFEQEIADLKTTNPLLIAFGTEVFSILNKNFRDKYRIVKIPHYSNYISKENYKLKINNILNNV